MPESLMQRLGAVSIFHARWVILTMSGLRSSFTRKMASNWDAQSHDPKRSKSNQKNYKQNSPRFDVSWRHPLFRASHGLMIVGGGGVNTLPFCLGTAYNVCSMVDIGNSWLLLTMKAYLSKLFISISKSSSGTSANPCFPLRRAYLLLLCKSQQYSFSFQPTFQLESIM